MRYSATRAKSTSTCRQISARPRQDNTRKHVSNHTTASVTPTPLGAGDCFGIKDESDHKCRALQNHVISDGSLQQKQWYIVIK